MHHSIARTLGTALLLSLGATAVHAGRIVVNHDEWTNSDIGHSVAGGTNAASYAVNLANFLAGAGGSILIYSDNFGLTDLAFGTALTTAGFSVTYSTGAFNLTGFDAVFLGGTPFAKNDTTLANFVNGGGGVYIVAGTGGDPAAEAATWNSFLTPFGLQYDGTTYNGCCGNDPIDNPAHPLFTGVSQLYYDNGNTVTASGPFASIVESSSDGVGLIGVYDNTVPEPATYLLTGAALAALAWKRRQA